MDTRKPKEKIVERLKPLKLGKIIPIMSEEEIKLANKNSIPQTLKAGNSDLSRQIRLSKNEIDCLKTAVYNISKEAKIYLFGSRVHINKKGGDIDLLIISKKMTKRDLRKIRIEFFKRFGEQKMDIILDDGKLDDPFVKYIFQKAVEL